LKRIFKQIINLYLILNIHVALAVTALYLVFNSHWNASYVSFIFFSTIISYNFIRILSFGSNRFFIKKYYAHYKKSIFKFLVISAIFSLYFFLKINLETQLALIPLFLITFLYNFDYKNLPRFRDNGIIKILIVGFVWSGLTVLIPNFESINKLLLLKTLLVFLYVVMLTLGFDKRDIVIDDRNLKTIPQLFPDRMFVIYLTFFIILSGLNFMIYDNALNWINELIIFLSSLMSYRSNTEKSFYYTAFWLEAMPIFWFLSLLLTKKVPL